jgi:hypothetical protein
MGRNSRPTLVQAFQWQRRKLSSTKRRALNSTLPSIGIWNAANPPLEIFSRTKQRHLKCRRSAASLAFGQSRNTKSSSTRISLCSYLSRASFLYPSPRSGPRTSSSRILEKSPLKNIRGFRDPKSFQRPALSQKRLGLVFILVFLSRKQHRVAERRALHNFARPLVVSREFHTHR